ncbi:MAG TPA: DMT family transporter [Thermoplasmata archaeon]|nr:DMT family transporter [Thermoplasmata archaeon]
MELWLTCALLTVVCYGVGEGLSKEPTVRLGSARMLVLYALGSSPIYAAWFFLGSGWTALTPSGILLGIASGVCGCLGTWFWFRAMESGTASVVSGFTAAYPVITVAAAVVILGVSLVPLQVVAILFLLVGAVLLGVYDHPGHLAVGRAWLAPMLGAVVMWGAWGIAEKLSIEALGFAGNAGIYVLVSTPIYLILARKGLSRKDAWDRVGVREALPSLGLFAFAGITIFLAVGLGPVAIVVPLTTAYPVVAILVRRFWMDERMTFPQKFAIGLAMLGAVLAAI